VVTKILTGIGAVILLLVAWMVYANVLSAAPEVLAKAEKLAREKAKCGEGCGRTRVEGSSWVIDKRFDFTFGNGANVKVVCRRSAIAFGDFGCSVK
jgi:hypothetical protein